MRSADDPDRRGLTRPEIAAGTAALVHHRVFEPKLPGTWALAVLAVSAAPGFVWLALMPAGQPMGAWLPMIALAGPPALIYSGGGRLARDWIARRDRFPFVIDPAIVRPGFPVTGTLDAPAPCDLCVVLLARSVSHFRDAELDDVSEVHVERTEVAKVAKNGSRFDLRVPADIVPSNETEQIGETASTYWIRVEPADGRTAPAWAAFRKSDRPIHVLGPQR